jgi:adenine-specific DNA-methyltransferase
MRCSVASLSKKTSMKGFVPTPEPVVDLMVAKLFHVKPPNRKDVILDPGCGRGAFIEGIIRWCRKRHMPLPNIVGVESDPSFIEQIKEKFSRFSSVKIVQQDFLATHDREYDYIIGNPPYVSITKLSERERAVFRGRYATAKGRFDLYLLFFERALSCLKRNGRLVFITPEKFLYVETARPLRLMLGKKTIEEIHLVDENVFGDLATYPTITTVVNTGDPQTTRVILRNGRARDVRLSADASSWMPFLNGRSDRPTGRTLKDICFKISCGVATGADSVFVVKTVAPELKHFAYPTIAGQEISPVDGALTRQHFMLMPYSPSGDLLPEKELGELGAYLRQPHRREMLLRRSCVARKPWYSFHETPRLPDILRPKILCKDITRTSFFVVDQRGDLVPRHSVYYIVPKDPSCIHELADYLNSSTVSSWLRSNCQRVTNDFLRLQSHVLKQLPVPDGFLPGVGDDSTVSNENNLTLAFG